VKEQHFDVVVIGGGQAGLAMGYYLAQQKRDFIILDANERIGRLGATVGIPYDFLHLPHSVVCLVCPFQQQGATSRAKTKWQTISSSMHGRLTYPFGSIKKLKRWFETKVVISSALHSSSTEAIR
jgi:cation diffusion facilitator CzcD-associated flavoprotein CzcO